MIAIAGRRARLPRRRSWSRRAAAVAIVPMRSRPRRRPPRSRRPSGHGRRSPPPATASVPTAASSPSGSAGPTRPRSCSSSTAAAPVFDATTCAFTGPGSGGGYDWSIFGEDPAREGRIFDFARADNPFRDYSFLYVPSYTGDAHLGDVTREYSPELTVEHNAFVNGTAALSHLAEHRRPRRRRGGDRGGRGVLHSYTAPGKGHGIFE
jgi:hypothetical protein